MPRRVTSTFVRGTPRIVVDGRMVGRVPHGFSRYITNLARGLAALRDAEGLWYEMIFLVGATTPASAFSGFGTVAAKAPFLSVREFVDVPLLLRKLGASLFHSPTFASFFGRSLVCPWIATVHDLSHLTYGRFATRVYYECLLKPFARRAAALVTVSNFSRSEITAWTGLPDAAIEIVPNAVDHGIQHAVDDAEISEVLARFGLERGEYFFCLSNLKAHKNLPLLVEAYARHRQGATVPGWPLVISVRYDAAVEGVRGVGSLNDADVSALMAGAGAFVFPSLYEGFGLPPVEAAVSGVPLLVSRIPPHEEGLAELQAGEVQWVDPRSLVDWVAALGRAERGEIARPSPESRARTVARFSTDRMARAMDRIYRRVLAHTPRADAS